MNDLEDKIEMWIAYYCIRLPRDTYNDLYAYLLNQPLYHQYLIYERTYSAYMNKILPIVEHDKFTDFCARHLETTRKVLILTADWIKKHGN